jgi:hypothetical protein
MNSHNAPLNIILKRHDVALAQPSRVELSVVFKPVFCHLDSCSFRDLLVSTI